MKNQQSGPWSSYLGLDRTGTYTQSTACRNTAHRLTLGSLDFRFRISVSSLAFLSAAKRKHSWSQGMSPSPARVPLGTSFCWEPCTSQHCRSFLRREHAHRTVTCSWRNSHEQSLLGWFQQQKSLQVQTGLHTSNDPLQMFKIGANSSLTSKAIKCIEVKTS